MAYAKERKYFETYFGVGIIERVLTFPQQIKFPSIIKCHFMVSKGGFMISININGTINPSFNRKDI